MTFFSVFTYAEVKADPIEPKYRVSFNFFQPTVPGRYPLCELLTPSKISAVPLCCRAGFEPATAMSEADSPRLCVTPSFHGKKDSFLILTCHATST